MCTLLKAVGIQHEKVTKGYTNKGNSRTHGASSEGTVASLSMVNMALAGLALLPHLPFLAKIH